MTRTKHSPNTPETGTDDLNKVDAALRALARVLGRAAAREFVTRVPASSSHPQINPDGAIGPPNTDGLPQEHGHCEISAASMPDQVSGATTSHGSSDPEKANGGG